MGAPLPRTGGGGIEEGGVHSRQKEEDEEVDEQEERRSGGGGPKGHATASGAPVWWLEGAQPPRPSLSQGWATPPPPHATSGFQGRCLSPPCSSQASPVREKDQ